MKHFGSQLRFALRSLSLTMLLVLALSRCISPDSDELAAAQAAEAQAAQDSLENEFAQTLTDINDNLDRIRERQGLISVSSGEAVSKKQAILDNISLINSLLEENRRKNDMLTIQVRKLGKDKNALARLADQAKARIAGQEEEIQILKDQLAEESFKVSELNRQLTEAKGETERLAQEAAELNAGNTRLDKEANTAWFAYGTMEQLMSRGLIEKRGGILGIGQKEKLTAAFHRNKGVFTAVDTRNIKEIPLYGKRPRLLTDHPEGAYKIEVSNDYSKLLISDPEDFWSRSRFLVVEVRGK